MKKILILIAMAVLTSCSLQSYVIGDVTLMNDEGVVMRSYPNSILEYHDYTTGKHSYSIKNGGMVSFEDSNGISHLIGGGIICVDNVQEIAEKEQRVISDREKLMNDIHALDKSIQTMTKRIKEEKKNGGDTAELEKLLEEKKTERDNLANTLWEKYNTTPNII